MLPTLTQEVSKPTRVLRLSHTIVEKTQLFFNLNLRCVIKVTLAFWKEKQKKNVPTLGRRRQVRHLFCYWKNKSCIRTTLSSLNHLQLTLRQEKLNRPTNLYTHISKHTSHTIERACLSIDCPHLPLLSISTLTPCWRELKTGAKFERKLTSF